MDHAPELDVAGIVTHVGENAYTVRAELAALSMDIQVPIICSDRTSTSFQVQLIRPGVHVKLRAYRGDSRLQVTIQAP